MEVRQFCFGFGGKEEGWGEGSLNNGSVIPQKLSGRHWVT